MTPKINLLIHYNQYYKVNVTLPNVTDLNFYIASVNLIE